MAGGVATLLAAGIWALSTLPFEAFPDLTANSVSVIADAPGLAPQEVEQLVTFPVERAMLGLPDTEAVRSTSKFGVSITQVVFADGVDTYFARQLVAERMSDVSSDLPQGATVSMGPVSTAMGEVFQYVLTSRTPEWDLQKLKTLQDWTLAPQLRTVPGVAEVNSWGGFTQELQVIADPRRLAEAQLSLGDLEAAIARDDRNFGGAYVEDRGERFVVRGVGRLRGASDLEKVTVAERGGAPLRLADVATVVDGALPRSGAVSKDGLGEVVSGMVIMRKGENAQDVITRIKERVRELERTLPPGVHLVPFYDQTELVSRTTHTIEKNLLLGGSLVILLLWVFLRNLAASLIVALVIPLSMLFAFIAMRAFGYSANLMSLGALDFGLLVDGSVVVIENVMRRSRDPLGHEGVAGRVLHAAVEVGRPVVFGIAIIVAVYLPIFALGGTERRMFVPMAFTVVAALLGSLVLALTAVPAAARTFLGHAHEQDQPWLVRLAGAYRRVLDATMRHRAVVLLAALACVVAGVFGLSRLGREFMPRLDEGAVLVQGRRPPSMALEDGVRTSTLIEKTLLELPEVRTVVSKLGRPDLATEAMGSYESDSYVMLAPREEWREGGKDALLDAMDARLGLVPGLDYAFTQPIQMRLDEAESGITTDVGVRIFGDDPPRLAALAASVERALEKVPGAAEVKTSAAERVRQLEVILDREALSRLGLSAEVVGAEVERALGASKATHVVDGARRIPVAVRAAEAGHLPPELVGQLLVPTPDGARVPLSSVARIAEIEAPEAFAHEGGQRLVVVGANVRGRDVVGFVEEARETVGQEVPLPPGYRLEWGGQYTHQRSAVRRLSIIGPLALLAIYLLLFAAFRKLRQAVLIMVNVPFALVGGVLGLSLARLDLSISALIGFIALFGIAVLNGVVMVSSINDRRHAGEPLVDAVREGAAARLRPVLMTATAAGLGFLPMALSHAPGAELQRPLATVVIGGLVTATALTLLVLPTLYVAIERWFQRSRPEDAAEEAEEDAAPART